MSGRNTVATEEMYVFLQQSQPATRDQIVAAVGHLVPAPNAVRTRRNAISTLAASRGTSESRTPKKVSVSHEIFVGRRRVVITALYQACKAGKIKMHHDGTYSLPERP